MKATIAKRFTFDAAHCLPNLPPDHKCHRMHGHTYEVELVFGGPVDPRTGFVVDYSEIAAWWQPIHQMLDHRVLNEVPGLAIPSTEHLAAWICLRFYDNPRFERVRIKESSTTWCEMAPGDFGLEGARARLGLPAL